MSARATAIAVVALLVLGVALIAQAWRMKDYSLNVSIARERQDDDPEMLRNYHRYFGTGTDWVRRGDSRSAALCRKANLNRYCFPCDPATSRPLSWLSLRDEAAVRPVIAGASALPPRSSRPCLLCRGGSMTELLFDAAGPSVVAGEMPGFHAGRPPRNKGQRYPADPPTVEEIVAVMRAAGDGCRARRLRGLIVVLWRAGLRIHEALGLNESDLDHRRGALLVRRGKGGRRREVGMVNGRASSRSPGSTRGSSSRPVRCSASSTNGTTRGRSWSAAAARADLRRPAATAGVRRRFAPHQLRRAHAVEMAREGVPLIVIQRQLGHSNLGITSIYLQGIDNAEIIDTVHARRAPMVPVSASLQL